MGLMLGVGVGRGFILVSHRLKGTIHGSSVPTGEAFVWPPPRKECKRKGVGPEPREQTGLEMKEQWQVSPPNNTDQVPAMYWAHQVWPLPSRSLRAHWGTRNRQLHKKAHTKLNHMKLPLF